LGKKRIELLHYETKTKWKEPAARKKRRESALIKLNAFKGW